MDSSDFYANRQPEKQELSLSLAAACRQLAMAADASFLVLCSDCSAALQVYLPAGISSVRCDLCSHVFKVEVLASDLPHRTPIPHRQPRKERMLPAVLDAFNRFKAPYMLRLKAEEPALSQREFLKRAAILWHTAPENPKNGCQAAAAGEAAGAEGAAGGGAVDDEPALDGAGAGGSGDEMEAAAQAMLMVAQAPEGV